MSARKRARLIRAYLLRVLLFILALGLIAGVFWGISRIFRQPSASAKSSGSSEAGNTMPFSLENFSAGEAGIYTGEPAGDEKKAPDMNVKGDSFAVDSKGRITQTIEEPFDENSYSADELKELIETKISEYPQPDCVKLESLKAGEGSIKVVLSYESAGDFRSFNDQSIFIGSPDELKKQGITFDPSSNIKGDRIMVFATSEPGDIKLPGNIVDSFGSVSVTGKRTVKFGKGDGISYVVYKRPFLNIF
ncbi:MAG: hypothetical protein IKR68_02795 [Lachnospiraceae bacterium]|nr:hypothetical protein [Lachnospiraceae bacterium]